MARNEDWTPSIDLASKAQHHIVFLKQVNDLGFVDDLDIIHNAIRRYEVLWLPLLSKHDKELEPPIDIHWIWHCHMLSPKAYAVDCQNVTGTVLDHFFRIIKSEVATATEKAEKAWKESYPDEPFHVDFSAPVPKENLVQRESKINYDLVAASERQKSFYYQVSLPHFTCIPFLSSSVNRYIKFVNLKKTHPKAFLVPVYDVDLIWHTHQLHPHCYAKDMEKALGYMLNHDDETTDRSPSSKLSVSDAETRKLWKKMYNTHFHVPGTLYRGPSPKGKLHDVTNLPLISVGKPFYFHLSIDNFMLTGPIKSKYVLGCEVGVSAPNQDPEATRS